jgi:hypothetical protein
MIGTSLFYANYRFELNDLTRTIEVLVDNPIVVLTVTEIREIYASLRLDLIFYR